MAREQAFLSTEIVNQGVQETGPNAGSMTFSVRVRRRLPDFLQSVNLKYVKLGYHYLISHAVYLFTVPVILLAFSAEIGSLSQQELWRLWEQPQFDMTTALTFSGATVFMFCLYFMSRPRSIYLVDFACFKPSDDLKVSKEDFINMAKKSGHFEDASLDFQKRILDRSGLGEETYLPKAVMGSGPCSTMKEGRAEAEMMMFGALDELFDKCKVRPKDIGILVVNCSLFNPTPSLSAMIVNHYKMRGNILSFNLGGMGCSAGIISLDLARDMLQAHPNSHAVVVSTEMITFNWYTGTERSMLMPNCFFRMGCAAILLSNKRKDRRRAKYELSHIVRTHKGADERSFRCVFQQEDDKRKKGLSVSRDLLEIGGHALKANITTLGPLVLPVSEQLLFLATLICRKVLRMKHVKPYIPDFKLAFEHFCIHAGSKTILDELQNNLLLTDKHMEASRMTLHRFGNTSSSSLWYELAYMEAKRKIKNGDRIWQIAFGSGFKCNSAVWKALRTVKKVDRNPWVDCIERYPVEIPDVQKV
ncbi:hypothetical protein KI387_010291 [Taxus chinensis]|uniref:3-ketoacyl-CoA synthase n=1 Tax=Taxus chinensis TaxID=29808 RepID=A0AA38KVJ6_TAXCH|nr:hypothetical protein KI387_010291 [Taxus chinensis]